MSEENAAIVERWIRAYHDRNLAALEEIADPAIELRPASTEPLAGHEGLAAWAARGWEGEAPHYPSIERLIVRGDIVFGLINIEMRSYETGEVLRVLPVGARWRIAGGRVAEWAARPDREALLEEAGEA
jgi:hypothetical protein